MQRSERESALARDAVTVRSANSVAVVGGRAVGRPPGDVHLLGDRIAAGRGPAGLTVDAEGCWVCPGLVDLQVNGGYGIDLVTEPERVWELGRRLPAHGVTAFAPTIISSAPGVVARAVDALRDRPPDYDGAEPLGVHAEGPMLNPARAGAHPVERLRPPSIDVIDDWQAHDHLAMVTLAPELPGAAEVVAELVGQRVTVAAGHSDATAAEAAAAVDAGVTAVTHLFNAMAPFGHREPGLVGAALSDPALVAGVIVDGVHVDPVAVRMAWRAKGPGGLYLVTDAVAATGLGPGRHELGRVSVTSDGRSVQTDDGVLAGSLLTMDEAVRNLVEFTGCSVDDAVAAASTTPAEVIGRHDRGHLAAGAVADLTLLDDELTVVATVCRGRIAFVAETARDRLSGSVVV